MKRNLDIFRMLLLKIEAIDTELYPLSEIIQDDDCDMCEISYHLELLRDAGFVELNGAAGGFGFRNHLIVRITNAGHDYLDSVRDESIWSKTKEKCSMFDSVALNVIQSVASSIALRAFGLKE